MQHRGPTSTTTPTSLSPLCFGGDDETRFRRLAWTCSICALFVTIGVAGLLARDKVATPVGFSPARIIAPVVFTPLQRTSLSAAPTTGSADQPTAPEAVAESPIAITTVALPGKTVSAVSPEAILSPLPAGSPPSLNRATPPGDRPSRFEPTASAPDTPQPAYPPLALRRGYEGTVVIEFAVSPAGQIADARLGRSSGYLILDEAALDTVRTRWTFPPGAERHHFVEIVFQLK